MAGEVRDRMIEGAVALLGRRGLQATSFAEVLELTGAPRGSVYHHFPDGKDQLVGSAIELAGAQLIDALNRKAGASALEITEFFFYIWRTVLTRSDCEAGCAVLAVTVATDSADLIQQASAVFRTWRSRLTELLVQGGMNVATAGPIATTLIAGAEGAVVLSRAEHSLEPFEQVASQMIGQIRQMTAA